WWLTYSIRQRDRNFPVLPVLLTTSKIHSRTGVDFHFDWGASQYQQVTPDSGQHPILRILRVARDRDRPPDRLQFPDWKNAGIFEPERLRRIRPGKSAVGLEYFSDV